MGLRKTKIIEQVKASFLTLCEQYEEAGHLFQGHARILVDKSLWNGQVGEHLRLQLAQYQEIGEQMKTLGAGIDLLGGKSVMHKDKQVQVISGTRNELKRMGIDVRGRKCKGGSA